MFEDKFKKLVKWDFLFPKIALKSFPQMALWDNGLNSIRTVSQIIFYLVYNMTL